MHVESLNCPRNRSERVCPQAERLHKRAGADLNPLPSDFCTDAPSRQGFERRYRQELKPFRLCRGNNGASYGVL
jgi:hypothetical protein